MTLSQAEKQNPEDREDIQNSHIKPLKLQSKAGCLSTLLRPEQHSPSSRKPISSNKSDAFEELESNPIRGILQKSHRVIEVLFIIN